MRCKHSRNFLSKTNELCLCTFAVISTMTSAPCLLVLDIDYPYSCLLLEKHCFNNFYEKMKCSCVTGKTALCYTSACVVSVGPLGKSVFYPSLFPPGSPTPRLVSRFVAQRLLVLFGFVCWFVYLKGHFWGLQNSHFHLTSSATIS